ncbi:MAG: hypothetical protein GYB36_03430 [Alphaproteobacteria bacterium]|nr:hypothetical protein [Alphaproteobacteria bacterium]
MTRLAMRRTVTVPSNAIASALAFILLLTATGVAQSDPPVEPQTLRAAIGDRVVRALTAEEGGHYGEAIYLYDALLESGRLTGYEEATLLQLRGRAWYELEDADRAIADWQAALALNSLETDAANTLRLNTGQLLLAREAYAEGVFMIETALTLGARPNADIAMRLAQGYAQLEDYGSGLRWAELAFESAAPRQERHYLLALFYYQALEMTGAELALIRDMVHAWPEEKRYWTTLASLLARTGREQEAFEVNAVMYLNGLLSESDEILRLVQYYAFYDYPYRGADILQRELNSGRVTGDPANFRLLASLWRQAREWDEALPILRRVATTTGRGADYEALGEALYQSAQYAEAEVIFVQALERGGVRRPGDTWTLLGNARFELDQYEAAINAFSAALQYPYSRQAAQGWIDFVEQRLAIQAAGERFVHVTAIETCELWLERAEGDVLRRDEVNAAGERIYALPSDCQTYFTETGERLPEWEDA